MDGLAYDELPSDINSLKSLVIERDRHALDSDQKIVLLEAKVAKLEEEKRLDRARRFGASSEAGDHQYRLFDEAEAEDDSVDPAMRGWMNDSDSYIQPVALGAVMRGSAISRVVQSKHSDFAEGDMVFGAGGGEWSSVRPSAAQTIASSSMPVSRRNPVAGV